MQTDQTQRLLFCNWTHAAKKGETLTLVWLLLDTGEGGGWLVGEDGHTCQTSADLGRGYHTQMPCGPHLTHFPGEYTWILTSMLDRRVARIAPAICVEAYEAHLRHIHIYIHIYTCILTCTYVSSRPDSCSDVGCVMRVSGASGPAVPPAYPGGQ